MKKYEIIRPGEPGYDKAAASTSGQSISLVAALRFIKDDLRRCRKMESQGIKTTIPELPQDGFEPEEARDIKGEIVKYEKMKKDMEEVIAWAETREPGCSKKQGSSCYFYEFEIEKAKKKGMLSRVTEQQKLDFVRSLTVRRKKISQNLSYEDSLNEFYRDDFYEDPYMAVVQIAYDTLKRNVRGIGNHPRKDKIYNEARPFLRHEIMHLSAETKEEFDVWHRKTAEHLINIFAKNGYEDFTVGEAQKWINMALKHLSIFNPLMTILCYGYLHIPIDSYIIDGLNSPIVPDSLRGIDTTFDQVSKPHVSWSSINDYDKYLAFQKEIREKCGEIPMDFEFWFWPKAYEYLDRRSKQA